MNFCRPSRFILLCITLSSGALTAGPAYSADGPGIAPQGIRAPNHPTEAGKPAQRDWAEKLRRAPVERAPAGALFESKSWIPPTAVATAEPTPPPFPYQYMGRLETEGKPDMLYLTKGNHVYSVAVGDVIEGIYRVAAITSDQVEVTYLPLGKKQLVAFSSIVPAAQPQANYTSVNPSFPVGGRAAGSPNAVAGQQVPSAGASVAVLNNPAPPAQPPGPSSGSIVVSAPTIAAMPTSAPTNAAMPTSAPTMREMPISPPSGPAMVISPPSGVGMPITPPAGSM